MYFAHSTRSVQNEDYNHLPIGDRFGHLPVQWNRSK